MTKFDRAKSKTEAKKLLNNNEEIYKIIIYSEHCEDMCDLLKKEFKKEYKTTNKKKRKEYG